MDNDNILSRMVTFDFITFHDDVPKIKSNPARSDRNLALWNMLADRIQIRDRFKQLCDIIKEQKQSSIANALLTAWLEESGGIAL